MRKGEDGKRMMRKGEEDENRREDEKKGRG